jgi:hypothetical protein
LTNNPEHTAWPGKPVLVLAAQHPHLIGDKVSAAVLAATTSGLDRSARHHPPITRLVGILNLGSGGSGAQGGEAQAAQD